MSFARPLWIPGRVSASCPLSSPWLPSALWAAPITQSALPFLFRQLADWPVFYLEGPQGLFGGLTGLGWEGKCLEGGGEMAVRPPAGAPQPHCYSPRRRVGLCGVDVLYAWDVQQGPRPLPTRCPGGPYKSHHPGPVPALLTTGLEVLPAGAERGGVPSRLCPCRSLPEQRGFGLAPGGPPLGGGWLSQDGRGQQGARVSVAVQGQEARTVQSPPEAERKTSVLV